MGLVIWNFWAKGLDSHPHQFFFFSKQVEDRGVNPRALKLVPNMTSWKLQHLKLHMTSIILWNIYIWKAFSMFLSHIYSVPRKRSRAIWPWQNISTFILHATCLLLNLLGNNLVKIIYSAKLLLIDNATNPCISHLLLQIFLSILEGWYCYCHYTF